MFLVLTKTATAVSSLVQRVVTSACQGTATTLTPTNAKLATPTVTFRNAQCANSFLDRTSQLAPNAALDIDLRVVSAYLALKANTVLSAVRINASDVSKDIALMAVSAKSVQEP